MLKEEISKLDMFLELLDYHKPKIKIKDDIIEVKKEDIIKALKIFKDRYKVPKKGIPMPVYIYLIKENILFLDPIEGTLKPQSHLVWNAIKRLL